jgi:predicted Zn finger-like uncharacterized protein
MSQARVHIACPQCGSRFGWTGDALAGAHRVRCPKCRTVFVVQGAAPAPAAPQASVATPPAGPVVVQAGSPTLADRLLHPAVLTAAVLSLGLVVAVALFVLGRGPAEDANGNRPTSFADLAQTSPSASTERTALRSSEGSPPEVAPPRGGPSPGKPPGAPLPSSDLPPDLPSEGAGRKLALLVGINDYDERSGLGDLEFAENDAAGLGRSLKNCRFDEVVVLTGSAPDEGHRPTRANLLAQVQRLCGGLSSDDFFLLSFCGHGIVLDGAAGAIEPCLCPSDAKIEDRETLVPVSQIIERVVHGGPSCLLFDACRDRGTQYRGISERSVAAPEGVTILFSCKDGQRALENRALEHGLFTYCILEGLDGKAASFGEVTISSLVEYVQRRMDSPEMTKLMVGGARQQPIPAGGTARFVVRTVDEEFAVDLQEMRIALIASPLTREQIELVLYLVQTPPEELDEYQRAARLIVLDWWDSTKTIEQVRNAVARLDPIQPPPTTTNPVVPPTSPTEPIRDPRTGQPIVIVPPPAPNPPAPSGPAAPPNGVGLSLVWCAPGVFRSGSPPGETGRRQTEEEQVDVVLSKGFWIAAHETTQQSWEQVMGYNFSSFAPGGEYAGRVSGPAGLYPVENVSWYEAMEFCRLLTEQERKSGNLPANLAYRLPTDAEWEYACRAGTTTPYSCGTELTAAHANVTTPGRDRTAATMTVGGRQPNPWGLYDLHGNVFEWCLDQYIPKRAGGTDPLVTDGPEDKRCARGGAYAYSAGSSRSAARRRFPADAVFSYIGFRVVLAEVSPAWQRTLVRWNSTSQSWLLHQKELPDGRWRRGRRATSGGSYPIVVNPLPAGGNSTTSSIPTTPTYVPPTVMTPSSVPQSPIVLGCSIDVVRHPKTGDTYLEITAVAPGSVAQVYGLRPGDILVAVNGLLVSTRADYDAALLASPSVVNLRLMRPDSTQRTGFQGVEVTVSR